MCLLIVLFGVVADAPLIVAANRDELYQRPAVAMTILRAGPPRVLGGRDAVAGGTWLAVNDRGLVAGLTNQPSAAGRDPAKRSRGELPLAFAGYPSAAEAIASVPGRLNPADYNPCWMLVADRHSLFYVDIAGGDQPVVEQLPPGVHILENAPLRAQTAKVARVRELLAAGRRSSAAAAGDGSPAGGPASGATVTGGSAQAAVAVLATVLRDHTPAAPETGTAGAGAAGTRAAETGAAGTCAAETGAAGTCAAETEAAGTGPVHQAGRPPWPAALSAACVHTPAYGTRSALIVTVGPGGVPLLQLADGPPCQAALRDETGLWAAQPRVAAAGDEPAGSRSAP